MTFTLIYGKGKERQEQCFINPSPEKIDEAIDNLIPALNCYVVLESNPPIDRYAYIQTLIKRHDDKPIIEYLVEVNVRTEDTCSEADWIQYQKSIDDAEEVKKLFRMFALEKIPDITGWEDVTKEIKNSLSSEKQKEIFDE